MNDDTRPGTADATKVGEEATSLASSPANQPAEDPTVSVQPAEPAAPASDQSTASAPGPGGTDPEPSETKNTEQEPAEPKPAPSTPAANSADPQIKTETKFGYIDVEGVVWVRDGEEARQVGSYPEDVPQDPFALYVRRYLDLEATVNLFEARLPSLPAADIDSTIKTLKEQLVAPAVVGDIPALRAQLDRLVEQSRQRKDQLRVERQRAREQALTDRTAVVEAAEEIAAQPPERTQWKNSGERLRQLLDEWRNLQRRGPRLDKPTEDKLWKRFSQARTTFDRGRRQFFSALDQRQKEAKTVKERLIAEAEAMQNSDDWRGTSAAYRDLMDQWKRAGRASRREDDDLWARFRAAQQVFFDNRRAHDRALDEKFGENLNQKIVLAEQAEALLPVEDIDATREKLRIIQDRWEEVGQVPSREVSRIEGRLKAVERALREAENREWRRSDPETKARASGMLAQLEDSITELQEQLDEAEASGDKKRIKEVSDALATKKMWYDQISASVD